MRYPATLDVNSKIVTHLVIILTIIFGYRQLTDISHDAISTSILLIILVPLILVAWSLSPWYYLITPEAIIIKRPLMSIVISLNEVIRLRSITEEDLGNSSRLLSVGGLFGYLGTYRSSEIGKYQRWCTNRESLVLIETENRKWLISPSEAEHFVKNVNKVINVIK